ncbi:DUF397 domain-containing protein [Streptomyces sp. NPDC017979]|uniref:DUF397 domain-containing protein n=1 Tax=Streptomyces sp. NPDC017979 TaxID=3365024 RepID=UPI0037A02D4A
MEYGRVLTARATLAHVPASARGRSGQGGECVEWAPGCASATGVVLVRDSKVPASPVLSLPGDAFVVFVTGVKGGSG